MRFEFDPVDVVIRNTHHEFKVFYHPGGAATLAVEEDRVLLIEQYRPAVGETILEIPAGLLEKGEDPLACAQRELEEETGYRAKKWTSLGTILPSPGYTAERIYLYRAEDLSLGTQNLDSGEDLLVKWFSLEEIRDLLKKGALTDSKTLIALLTFMSTYGS